MIISININSRSSTHIMVMFLAAGEPLKAARCVYAAAVRADVVFQPSTPAPPQRNVQKQQKKAGMAYLQLFISRLHDGDWQWPRCFSGSSRIHFKSRRKGSQQWRLSKRGLSCPNIRSPDSLLYISSAEPGAALFLAL